MAVVVIPTPAQDRQGTSSTQQSGPAKLDTGKRGFNISTASELYRICDAFGPPLVLVFVLGIFFVSQKFLVLRREQKDAKKIPVADIRTMSFEDLQKMMTQVREIQPDDEEQKDETKEKVPLLKRIFKQKKASSFQLINRLYKLFESQQSTASFNGETSSFLQNMKDNFNPFSTRVAFLSETAGALGLLGTVWGMFLVFYKGSPDPEDILQGMGIALATTIVGLVISISINSLTTVVSNMFDNHLDFLNNLAIVFQERLMREESPQAAKGQPIIVDPAYLENLPTPSVSPVRKSRPRAAEVEEQEEAPATASSRKKEYNPPAEIKIVSGDNQSGEVNTALAEPIIVEVLDAKGTPLENETVVLTAEEGAGVFPNMSRTQKLLTNDEGRIQTQFTLGKMAGEKTIQISVEGANLRGVKLLAIAKPTPPSKLVELKGNYQTGELGKRLPLPFAVAVRDKFDNPIARYEVDFSLKRGTGRFQDSPNAHYTTFTNEDGLAEVYFIVGNNRGAREIEVEAKKVEPSKLLFEVFAV
ncbi:MAG: MotA/TolQ/ExbB proton channel family protein [candidate division KSB1 bacterium]|nr:MotA/TolQ/ExbB proton channel family protein [candidate division KSB1 bacterium]